ncbi:MAG TPA: carboxypeptidase regulatory-like domain-containing protein [Bacteroidia bacterium]|nr:carboxypeptidase regulatory-like domain-containing protein [Bacteroidia bacterium]
MKRLTLSTLIICFFINVNAQLTQTIRGTVTDKETNTELIGANVVLLNTDPIKGGVTDINGTFRIEGVTLGRHTIKVTYTGYKEIILPDIIVNSAKEVVLKITMEEEVVEVSEAVVTAKSNPGATNNELVMISGRSFTIDQTQRYAGGLGDPSRMATNFAGVAGGGNDQRNDIVIRGNSPTGLLWRLEGVDIFNPNHFGAQGANGGPVSILNNNTLSNSDFLTGAFPSEYGNALSGVFDLKMRDGNNEKYEYTGQIGFSGVEFMAEGPIKKSKSSFLVNYRYSTLDFLSSLGFDFGGAGAPRWQDLTMKVNFGKTRFGNFSLFAIGGLSGTKIQDSKKENEDFAKLAYPQDIDVVSGMYAAGLVHTISLGKNSYLKTVISSSAQQNTTLIDSVTPAMNPFRTFVSESYNGRNAVHSFVNKKINARHSIKTGVIFTRFTVTSKDSFRMADSLVGGDAVYSWRKIYEYKAKEMFLGQAYVNWNWKLSEKATLNAGLHYNHLLFNNSVSVEPRTSFRYKINNQQSLSFGYGLHSQMQPIPVYFELTFTDPQRTQSIETNRNLDFTKSHHFVGGYEIMLNQNVRFKTEAYYQYLTGVAVTQNPSFYSTINFGADYGFPNVDSLVNDGLGRNYGIEFTLERFFNNGFYYLGTVSLYQSEYLASDNKWRNTAFNGNFVANALFGREYKTRNNGILSMNLRVTYAGGRRYPEIDLEKSRVEGREVHDESRAYENRVKDFFRTDFRIGFKKNGKRVTHEWAIDIQNIFNIQNVLLRSYNAKTGEIQTFNQIGIFPVPFYRIQF